MADTLEFQNLKHIKSGLGLTPVSTADKCLVYCTAGHLVVLMPVGQHGMRPSVDFLQATAYVCCSLRDSESASNARGSNISKVKQC